jgi:hypothetical protein
MTGIGTARETAAVSSQSNPLFVPSRSIEVRRISPRPDPRPPSPIRPPRAACPPVRCARTPAPAIDPLCVDRDNRRLAAIARRKRRDEGRIAQRGGVQADLLGARINRGGRIVFGSNAAADGKRNENAFRHRRHRLGERAPPFECRRDIEDDDLVDAFFVIALGKLGRIAGVSEAFEIDALDDLSVPYVEAGDDSFRQHRENSSTRANPRRPIFPGETALANT